MISSGTKILLVGDGAVGKTTLITQVNQHREIEREGKRVYNPSNSPSDLIDGNSFELVDSLGEEASDYERRMRFAAANVILICFSVISPSSFENVKYKWQTEVNGANPAAPMILVGTKSDLRNERRILERLEEKNLSPISTSQGEGLAKQIKAIGYVEVSVVGTGEKEGGAKMFWEEVLSLLAEGKKKKTKSKNKQNAQVGKTKKCLIQ
eukprot:TRINITY_DN3042_c0_g1_i2.p1 TRINITY_DN3042_c0_g1~~TRINITY_DN3042_c0_g1_i2.p1  ORF type:complete len:209 (-),score=77.29 TRINITY_DN3042_c0_g1_i2:435-1061(-)